MSANPATLISLATALFILPFVFCSGIAGLLADRHPKYVLVRLLKATECVLFVLAAIALITGHVFSLLAVLFLLGLQAAFFGPVKYAILPELLPKHELLAGNGLVEAGTFLCILVGTMLGGLLILTPGGEWIVAGSMLAMGAVGLIAAYQIPVTASTNMAMPMQWHVLRTTKDMLKHAHSQPDIFRAIMGISWFWALGATYLTQLPIFTKEVVGANQVVSTLYLGMFSVGIALGALICHRLLKGEPSLRLAPYALVCMLLAGADVWVAAHFLPARTADLLTLAGYLEHAQHWRIAVDIFIVAVAGGVFVVPLYTRLQTLSVPEFRARTIASNNVMNALCIALISLISTGLYIVGFDVRDVLLGASLLNIWLWWMLRKAA